MRECPLRTTPQRFPYNSVPISSKQTQHILPATDIIIIPCDFSYKFDGIKANVVFRYRIAVYAV